MIWDWLQLLFYVFAGVYVVIVFIVLPIWMTYDP